MLKISQLFIYPIKSLGGIALTQARVTSRGFEHDRRWMLIDENKHFLSQREAIQMALLAVALKNNGLLITHKKTLAHILIPFELLGNESCEVIIWDDCCTAVYVSNEADEWFTEILGMKCRLVYMPDDSMRQVDERYAKIGDLTSFSDAYAFLMIGQSSLDDLNIKMKEQLPVTRFRPNIVFTGGKPYEEDLMDNFSIGSIGFQGVKLCARCVIPTINQEDITKTKEPLKTLATYRRRNNDVYFGQNLVHNGDGIISVGDIIDIKTYHTDPRFII